MIWSGIFTLSPLNKDAILLWTLRCFAALSGIIVLLILLFLARESLPALRDIGLLRFANDTSWHPSEVAAEGQFNLLPMLWGTLFTTLGAVLLATPLGLLSALFCRFYAPPKLSVIYRRIMELLAGIPSVVYGFWGLVVLVPLIAQLAPPGASLLAGILILTIMIVPTVALFADAAIANVPQAYLNGAAALALSRWGTLWGVILPAARNGIYTGVILATGRAIGETMALLMVCGNVVQVPDSFFAPMRTLTANIALEMAYALGDHRGALFVSGLLLMAMVLLLVAVADRLDTGNVHG